VPEYYSRNSSKMMGRMKMALAIITLQRVIWGRLPDMAAGRVIGLKQIIGLMLLVQNWVLISSHISQRRMEITCYFTNVQGVTLGAIAVIIRVIAIAVSQ
jgi:uncharacterized RDD family membrane protein YckC